MEEMEFQGFQNRTNFAALQDAILAIRAEIGDPELRAYPLVGSVDQVSDSTPVLAHPSRAGAVGRAALD